MRKDKPFLIPRGQLSAQRQKAEMLTSEARKG
jgi:hypothetical protein